MFPIVAVTIFAPLLVELMVPVATPAEFVTPGCTIVLPGPVAFNVTVAPLIGAPAASRAVTVIVLVLEPSLALIVTGAASTVDCDALAGRGEEVIVNVAGSAMPVTLAVNVLGPGSGPSIHVGAAYPLASLVTGFTEVMVPPPSVTVKVTAMPGTRLL